MGQDLDLLGVLARALARQIFGVFDYFEPGIA
jgi:hypothetical protein